MSDLSDAALKANEEYFNNMYLKHVKLAQQYFDDLVLLLEAKDVD